MSTDVQPAPRLFSPQFDVVVVLALALGWLLLYGQTYEVLVTKVWSRDEQGHGPIILAVSLWLFWRRKDAVMALPSQPAVGLGIAAFVLALFLYVVGRSQAVLLFEVGSQIPLLISFLLLLKGPAALRVCWFPLFFLLFMVPLPATWVATLTTPLKSAVSAVASELLHLMSYPVGRTGVILTVGPYQLLVADACAGLNSMFTLEALGMLYMQLMNYTSVGRNVFLAIAIIPISFVANVVRVMILVLVTYHFGDEAGQGFVHSFAGMVLFMVALTFILAVDGLLTLGLRYWKRA